jgi:hypothetical protein
VVLIDLVNKDTYYSLGRYVVIRDNSLSFTKTVDDDEDITVSYSVNIPASG